MECEWMIKVSQMVDEELTAEESGKVRLHITECRHCSDAEHEFLKIRDEIRSYSQAHNLIAQKRALNAILLAENGPAWKRRIAVPVPIFTLVVLVAFITGAIVTRSLRGSGSNEEGRDAANRYKPYNSMEGSELSRFDRGERASIIILKKRTNSEVNDESR
jgi:hypothetical protein